LWHRVLPDFPHTFSQSRAKITFFCWFPVQIDPKTVSKFTDFPLSIKTLKGLKDNHYVRPTEIQRESIGPCLQGLDILGAAKTGCGKTLAFLIPVSS